MSTTTKTTASTNSPFVPGLSYFAMSALNKVNILIAASKAHR